MSVDLNSSIVSPDFVSGIIGNLVAAAILAAPSLAIAYSGKLSNKLRMPIHKGATIIIGITGCAALVLISYFDPKYVLVAYTLSSASFLWLSLCGLAQIGVTGFDLHVQTGFGYQRAIKLCTNRLDFLGTGAAKLTKAPGFEQAVQRCNRFGQPVRFLLTHPENPLLEEAARQAGESPDKYKRRVLTSLKTIATLCKEKRINIEVRFYKSEAPTDFQHFRMMFINEDICLLSYNIYGHGDGGYLPQLHLKNFHNNNNTHSFYRPFHEYFSRTWEEAAPWNPDDYIGWHP